MSGKTDPSRALPATARQALQAMAQRTWTAGAIVEAMIDRIHAPGGEGGRAYLSVDAQGARKSASAADEAYRNGKPGPLAGLPVAVKDLFDVEGQVTTAGSKVLAGSGPAGKDADMVARLKSAGAVILGRSHMNEFAYSALGTNPHFAQPRSPFERSIDGGRGRSPGGSTSGGAVAVADGLAYAALGSDTAGSTRVPAAFCGLTGWRPSQGRMSGAGAFPLARSFDTPGLITRTVDDCRLIDAVLTGDAGQSGVPPIGSLRLGRAAGLPFQELAPEVEASVERALDALALRGAKLQECADFDWDTPGAALRAGQVTAVEGLVVHDRLFERRDEYDPRVVARLRMGLATSAVDYVRAQRAIEALRRAYDDVSQPFDAIVMPTVAVVPPRLAGLDDDETFFAVNALALRNTMIASVLDLPAISIPVHPPGTAPVGLMLVGRRGGDRQLLAAAEVVENTLGNR